MTVYISGKITGTNDYEERFREAEKRLIIDGHKVINPVKVCKRKTSNGASWETCMRKCISELVKADAIYLLRDWRRSPGARLEYKIAIALDMIIICQSNGQ